MRAKQSDVVVLPWRLRRCSMSGSSGTGRVTARDQATTGVNTGIDRHCRPGTFTHLNTENKNNNKSFSDVV